MIKNILLALDNSKRGFSARQYALDLAVKTGAHVTGLGIVDTPWITASEPQPLGGGSYKMQRDDALLGQSHELLAFLTKDFQDACNKKGVMHSTLSVEGFPAIEIERIAHEHDIIIMGQTTGFHFDLDDETDLIVKHIARDNPRPLIILPDQVQETENIVLAFDGSMQASRAMHMFVLMGLGKGKQIHIIAIDKNTDGALAYTQLAVNLLKAHEVQAISHVMEPDGEVARQLLNSAQNFNASMIVMGGFSHSPLRETFFGSCTKTLMKESPIPLFIHH